MEETNAQRWERPDAPLGTLVYRAGLLSKEKLEAALQEGQRSGRRLGEVLLENGWIDEKDLARLLAGQQGLQFVSLRGRGYELQAARLLSERLCRFHQALPIEQTQDKAIVAIADPTDEAANQEIRDELRRDVEFVVSTASEVRAAIDEIWGSAAPAPDGNGAAPLSALSPIGSDFGLRIAAAPEPEREPDVDPVATESALAPAAEAAPAAEPEPLAPVVPETVLAPVPEPVSYVEQAAEPPTPEAAGETADPAEPTIQRSEDDYVSVAFHVPSAPAPVPPPAPDPVPAAEPVFEPDPGPAPAPAATTAPAAPAEPFEEDARFRLVMNLDGGHEIDVALFADEDEALAAGRELVAGIAKEREWPRVGHTFFPPERIMSVEIKERPRFTGSRERSSWGAS